MKLDVKVKSENLDPNVKFSLDDDTRRTAENYIEVLKKPKTIRIELDDNTRSVIKDTLFAVSCVTVVTGIISLVKTGMKLSSATKH